MNRFEEVPHLRSVFRQYGHDEAKKIKLVERIRDVALEYLPPAVIAKVPPPYFSDEARAAYAAKGISLEWNLNILGDTGVYAFFSTVSEKYNRVLTETSPGIYELVVTERDAVLTPSQLKAANLLRHCTEALEKDAVSDQLQLWILDAYAGLDSDAVEGRKKSNKVLDEVRQDGTDSNKEKSDIRHRDFEKAVNDYIDNYPNALALGVKNIPVFLKSKNLTFGYEDSTIKQYAKPFFAAKRGALKVRKT